MLDTVLNFNSFSSVSDSAQDDDNNDNDDDDNDDDLDYCFHYHCSTIKVLFNYIYLQFFVLCFVCLCAVQYSLAR